ncbi:phosphopantetheine-binding protein [Paenibacillus oleatilyticus]|uniref:phosphopantetheine-binding protein n=1 Tax=Paenibacillus oleatilyticus TaxID=2594886 RepID=UPI001C1F82DC|nr:phosphopantetheine-binding protein [Paenibacillus oleatilyticus]MBU7314900.1 acyl carrier protein [Paenibacillus oleatilyticus]
MTVREQISDYIRELTHEPVTDPSLNLFEAGLLTSLDVLDLISFLEETFRVTISEDDVNMESLGTMNGVVSLVERLRA